MSFKSTKVFKNNNDDNNKQQLTFIDATLFRGKNDSDITKKHNELLLRFV